MKKIINLTTLIFIITILFSCAGTGHITYHGVGQTKSDVLQRFGPPKRVYQSIENVETWEYPMGGAVKTYTFEGDKCIQQDSRAFNPI